MRRFRHCTTVVLGTPAGELLELLEASSAGARLLGFALARRALRPALMIPRCRSVHTWGMRFTIDVVFVAPVGGGSGMRVLAIRHHLPPRRIVRLGGERPPRSALDDHPECRVPAPLRRSDVCALELSAGTASRLRLRPGALLPMIGRTDSLPVSRASAPFAQSTTGATAAGAGRTNTRWPTS
ncbi:MAG: hypothetical protein WD844_03965 [Thermoleophilaceae bacterium]